MGFSADKISEDAGELASWRFSEHFFWEWVSLGSPHVIIVWTRPLIIVWPSQTENDSLLLQGELKVQRNKVTPLDDTRNPQRSGKEPTIQFIGLDIIVFFWDIIFFNGAAMKSKSSQISYMSYLWWERKDLSFWDFCHANYLGYFLDLFIYVPWSMILFSAMGVFLPGWNITLKLYKITLPINGRNGFIDTRTRLVHQGF